MSFFYMDIHNTRIQGIFNSGGDILLSERDKNLTIKRDEAIHLINEATEKIISIKKKIEEKNNQIPELQSLKNQLDRVYFMLGKKQNDLKEDFIALNEIIGKIKEKQAMILNEKTEVMLATIRANLPNDMKIVPEDNNIKVGQLIFKDDDIGKLKISKDSDNIVVNVQINGTDSVNFDVDDELEMYTIINHIITKVNYY